VKPALIARVTTEGCNTTINVTLVEDGKVLVPHLVDSTPSLKGKVKETL